MPEYVARPGQDSLLEEEIVVEVPRRFRVLLHNDHYTTMEFVIQILREIFHKPSAEARRIMMHVHENGVGEAGIYIRSVAEAKVLQVHEQAREAGFPLRSSIEPE